MRRFMHIVALFVVAGAWALSSRGANESDGKIPRIESDFIEGINPNSWPAYLDNQYDRNWYALPYTPRVSYSIDRIEFFHGVGAGGRWKGNVTIQVRANDNGSPSDLVLTEGSHALAFPKSLQGADLPPLQLTAGTAYWIVFSPVDSSQVSIADFDSGVPIPFFYSDDGANWTKVPVIGNSGERWVARFYGVLNSVAVEDKTWSVIKRLYASQLEH